MFLFLLMILFRFYFHVVFRMSGTRGRERRWTPVASKMALPMAMPTFRRRLQIRIEDAMRQPNGR
jgi:hypothetical protein